MLQDKLPRRMVHALHQLVQAFEDGHPVAPSQRRRQECRHFDVFSTRETVGHGKGVVRNENRHLVLRSFLPQKVLEFPLGHAAKIGLNSRLCGVVLTYSGVCWRLPSCGLALAPASALQTCGLLQRGLPPGRPKRDPPRHRLRNLLILLARLLAFGCLILAFADPMLTPESKAGKRAATPCPSTSTPAPP